MVFELSDDDPSNLPEGVVVHLYMSLAFKDLTVFLLHRHLDNTECRTSIAYSRSEYEGVKPNGAGYSPRKATSKQSQYAGYTVDAFFSLEWQRR